MSGDVQPRKRKDKKKKKDDLGVEEPRGTAAALGEGDVFLHSHHEHGTGGHWCAKIIFFSLLAVLITLIGLIILENRGLSELEANSVESRYSGVLEGWLEDAPDDDHHDEHTLELNHHDDDDHDEEHGEEAEEEIEKIEQEASDEEPISTELPALPEAEDDDEDDHDEGPASKEDEIDQDDDDDADDDDDDDFLDNDDDGDEPAVERITAPSGKPFDEVEEEVSSERPPNSLAEEEEYEKRQEQLRKEEEEQSSDMWLKLSVGGALLAATHAVLRRTRTDETTEDHDSREETPSAGDRRMTIIPDIPEEPEPVAPKKVVKEPPKPIFEIPKRVTKPQSIIKPPKEDSEEEEEIKPTKAFQSKTVTILSPKDKEIYSDEEDEPEEIKKPTEPEPESEEEVADDVEIIDEEIEEELEEEEDDISDVDDAELLTRLEAKYGRLPEPERPGMRKKDGGNSLNDLWPGEPSDSYWRQQLDDAERQLREDWLE